MPVAMNQTMWIRKDSNTSMDYSIRYLVNFKRSPTFSYLTNIIALCITRIRVPSSNRILSDDFTAMVILQERRTLSCYMTLAYMQCPHLQKKTGWTAGRLTK